MSETSITTQTQFFSFGYRCSSAGILKSLQLKHESFPFDWLISRLNVIKHCLEDDFHEFLEQSNYVRKYAKTYEMMDSVEGYVCDEHLMVNSFYQPPDEMDMENAYSYQLAMNHHNIWQEKDHEYYIRCVNRFRALMSSFHIKNYIHITPLMNFSKFEDIKENMLLEFIQFDNFMYEYSKEKTNGIFFVMVRPNIPKIQPYQPYMEVLYSSEVNNTRVYAVFTNSNIKDAGEIFMCDDPKVVDLIKSVIIAYQIL